MEGEADRQLLADIKKQTMIYAAELLGEKGLVSTQEELAMKALIGQLVSREGKGEGNAAGGNLQQVQHGGGKPEERLGNAGGGEP